ncbi:hypothetical protein JFL59_06310 [Histophilus somni]|uniref:hypothetical protein n=1 Tax=Histophilus somni TaxID=731 RepID=UPI001138013C|nr:hypothetical protein [Histophilus somni]QQF69867.1 hypothetical protein JFL59_06310 [Histophilus somni]TJY53087.1 hypothetical protein FAZ28_02740 [Histophilus somni]
MSASIFTLALALIFEELEVSVFKFSLVLLIINLLSLSKFPSFTAILLVAETVTVFFSTSVLEISSSILTIFPLSSKLLALI